VNIPTVGGASKRRQYTMPGKSLVASPGEASEEISVPIAYFSKSSTRLRVETATKGDSRKGEKVRRKRFKPRRRGRGGNRLIGLACRRGRNKNCKTDLSALATAPKGGKKEPTVFILLERIAVQSFAREGAYAERTPGLLADGRQVGVVRRFIKIRW